MILQRIKRKLYKAIHPVMGEIWMLHRVSEKPKQQELEVTPEWIERKILEYQKKGYSFISIDDLSTLITHHSSLITKRFVCVTFDDGYHDNYTIAYPMLKHLGVPFTVYVTTGFIDNKQEMWWYPEERHGLSMEELKALDADPICTIGAHTVSHPKLDTLSYEEQYKEIVDSKLELEQLLGHPIQHLSFPHGSHNADSLAICRELGFKTVVQSWGDPVRKGAHYDVLPRINMTQND